MIVIACKHMTKTRLREVFGSQSFNLINRFRAGALHLHSRESRKARGNRRTYAHRETDRAFFMFVRKVPRKEEAQPVFVAHENCEYMNPDGLNSRELMKTLWYQFVDCKKPIIARAPNSRLETRYLLLRNDGVWEDFTDLDHTFELET